MGQGAPRNRGCHRPLQTLRRAIAACKWDTGDKHEGLQQANVQDARDTLSLGEASLQRVPLRPQALRLPRCGPGQRGLRPPAYRAKGLPFLFLLVAANVAFNTSGQIMGTKLKHLKGPQRVQRSRGPSDSLRDAGETLYVTGF